MKKSIPVFILICSLWLAGCRAVEAGAVEGTAAGLRSPQVTQVEISPAATLVPPTSRPPAMSTAVPPTQIPVTATQPEPALEPTSVPGEPVTELLFTGVIVPARCVQASIDARQDPDYPYEAVREVIQAADLAVGTLNATISDLPPHTGCTRTYVLVGSSENADALKRAGFDMMSTATNHIKNCGISSCGDQAFFDTLDNLRRVGILPVGAGKNHAEAMQPVVVELNGVRFGIVSLGQIEQMAFAGENTPGIAILNEANLKEAIAAAREVSDVVIAMPHWGPEDAAVPTYPQRTLAEQIAAAGPDLIVGNHTHVVQGYGQAGGVPVFYGLGNFVFDQTWARDHSQGVILILKFKGKEYIGFEMIPTHVDGEGHVTIAEADEAQEILDRVEEASRGLQ